MTNETFRTWWTLFAQRWDRADQKELAAFYYAELRELSDAGFARACRLALRSLEFFPTVEQLEALAGEKPLRDPFAQWERIQPLLRYSGASLDSLDDPARRAVRAMGGLGAIGRDESALPFRRSEFIDLYKGFAESDTRLPELTDQSTEALRRLGMA